MAKSAFEYVKKFEVNDQLIPNCWLVVRIDGKGFTRFCSEHKFQKPNDERAIRLMNKCATQVMIEFPDIVISYGQSDEFSFILSPVTDLYKRRASKIATLIVSCFTSNYVIHWANYMSNTPLQYPPIFDGRVVCYPTIKNLTDYLTWRQIDCHINNLYNTCFWALVNKGNCTTTEAHERLKGTESHAKNEILFKEFTINYNDEPDLYRKGSILLKGFPETTESEALEELTVTEPQLSISDAKNKKKKPGILVLHEDMDKLFWKKHANILQLQN